MVLELDFGLFEEKFVGWFIVEVRELVIDWFGIKRDLFKVVVSLGVVLVLIFERGKYFLFDIWGSVGVSIVFICFFLEYLVFWVFWYVWFWCWFFVVGIFVEFFFFVFRLLVREGDGFIVSVFCEILIVWVKLYVFVFVVWVLIGWICVGVFFDEDNSLVVFFRIILVIFFLVLIGSI